MLPPAPSPSKKPSFFNLILFYIAPCIDLSEGTFNFHPRM